MKVIHLNYSDIKGGASIAAYRIHKAQVNYGINSKLIVHKKNIDDPNVIKLRNYPSTLIRDLHHKIESKFLKTFVNLDDQCSASVFPSFNPKIINSLETDIVNLHWINAGMLSIYEISKIIKPKVWTLHDMWPFSSIEHYPSSDYWKIGAPEYPKLKYLNLESIIKRYIFARKMITWQEPFPIVAPSEWIKEQVAQSKIMKSWPIYVINNPINLEKWIPESKDIARKKLNLPQNKNLVLFGSSGGVNDKRKGFLDLLKSLKKINEKIEIVIFGRKYPIKDTGGIVIHQMGYIQNSKTLNLLYSACDLLAIPSKQDNFPNTILESMAAETPVAGYQIGGIPELIDHKNNGYLAKKDNYKDFANGIEWILKHNKDNKIGRNARKWAEVKFSFQECSDKYQSLYEELLMKNTKQNFSNTLFL